MNLFWFALGGLFGGLFVAIFWTRKYDALYQASMTAIDRLLQERKHP